MRRQGQENENKYSPKSGGRRIHPVSNSDGEPEPRPASQTALEQQGDASVFTQPQSFSHLQASGGVACPWLLLGR